MGALGLDGAENGKGPTPPEPTKPQAKVKPMSRRLATNISQCSSKITEILSWEAKLKENKNGLSLACLLIKDNARNLVYQTC